MIGYEDYVKKIKERETPADFDGLRQAIGRKIVERQRARGRGALAGVCALLMIGLVTYFSYPLMQGGNGQLLSYVFEQQSASDGPVIDYVFSDTGTI
jgi:hypothetical protein